MEAGDREIFNLGASLDTLKWSEEVFELLFLTAYAWALWAFVLKQHVEQPHPEGHDSSPS